MVLEQAGVIVMGRGRALESWIYLFVLALSSVVIARHDEAVIQHLVLTTDDAVMKPEGFLAYTPSAIRSLRG